MYKTELIKNYIDFHGLTQSEFAVQAGVSKSTVSRLLNGECEQIRASTVKKMANVLGLPLSEFRTDAEEQPKDEQPQPTQLELIDNKDKYALPFPDFDAPAMPATKLAIDTDNIRRVVLDAVREGVREALGDVLVGLQEVLDDTRF